MFTDRYVQFENPIAPSADLVCQDYVSAGDHDAFHHLSYWDDVYKSAGRLVVRDAHKDHYTTWSVTWGTYREPHIARGLPWEAALRLPVWGTADYRQEPLPYNHK